MPHPFEDSFSPRRSPQHTVDEILNPSYVCLCGNRDLNILKNQKTFPVLEFTQDGQKDMVPSTCDVLECPKCGRQAEVAYEVCYSYVVLKEGSCVV